MRVCKTCQRFLGGGADSCLYCGFKDVTPLPPVVPGGEEAVNYKINPATVEINSKNKEGKHYRVLESAGTGAHGVVLKVEGPDHRICALKVPLEFNERFTNSQGNRKSILDLSNKYVAHEVEMLNKITGPGLLEVFYAGPVTCRYRDAECRFPGILMELAHATLKDLLDLQMSLQLDISHGEKDNIIGQLSHNLCRLHDTGFVHRDLSPHNVFVVERDGEIFYVFGDMGTSKPANVYDIDNSTTRMAFHDRYLDPALLAYDGFRYDRRLDIYQLGVMVTEIWMGEYWQTQDGDSAMQEIFSMDFEKEYLGKIASNELPGPLLKTLRKATTADISRRYRTAREFKRDLDGALKKAGQETGKKHSRDFFKKSIAISYNRVLSPSPSSPPSPLLPPDPAQEATTIENTPTTVHYRGQRKIDMGLSDELIIQWPGEISIHRASITGESFLECGLENQSVRVRINQSLINETVAVLSQKKKFKTTPWRLEFEGRSIVNIEGIPSKHPGNNDNKGNEGNKNSKNNNKGGGE